MEKDDELCPSRCARGRRRKGFRRKELVALVAFSRGEGREMVAVDGRLNSFNCARRCRSCTEPVSPSKEGTVANRSRNRRKKEGADGDRWDDEDGEDATFPPFLGCCFFPYFSCSTLR